MGVSTRTVGRMMDAGTLTFRTTKHGYRKLRRSSVAEYLRLDVDSGDTET